MKRFIAFLACAIPAAAVFAAVTPLPTPAWQRLAGTVQSIDRGQYQIEVSTSDGKAVAFQWTQNMRPFYQGTAIRWRELQKGDAVVILQSDMPVEMHPGPRDWSDLSGTVVSTSNKDRTFLLRLGNRSLIEFIESDAFQMSRSGLRVTFNDLQPGQTVRLLRSTL
jgi:hypothetical protein